MSRSEALKILIVCHDGRVASAFVIHRKVSCDKPAIEFQHVKAKITEACADFGEFVKESSEGGTVILGTLAPSLPATSFQFKQTINRCRVGSVDTIKVQRTFLCHLTFHLPQFGSQPGVRRHLPQKLGICRYRYDRVEGLGQTEG